MGLQQILDGVNIGGSYPTVKISGLAQLHLCLPYWLYFASLKRNRARSPKYCYWWGVRDGTTTFLTTGLCFPPASCVDGGKSTSPLPLFPQGRWVRGTAVPCSGFRSWLIHTCAKGLALLCHFVEVQGLPSGVLQWVGVGCQRLLSPSVPPQNRWVMGTVLPCSQIQDWLTHSSANRVASDTPPCQVHSLLSQRLLLMGEGVIRNSSPTLMTTGQLSHLSQVLMS